MVTTEGLLEAYYDCRRRKRATASAIAYELDYEHSLIVLRDRINSRTYTPGTSICFVVHRPRLREVFAASFGDRIVHHYIALRLEPLFENVFSDRSCSCRRGKGQLYAVRLLEQDIKECSKDYTKDCWLMKIDLKGFFMSIDQQLLQHLIDDFIVCHYEGPDKEDLRYLCRVVIMHEPEKNCERHSPLSYWDALPVNKSLFTNGAGKGMPIGNCSSQIFANLLLNELDWLVERLGIKRHVRYMDDMVMVHQEKGVLLRAMPLIRSYLRSIGLCLNEKKFYLQHYSKGVEFTGGVVRPGRKYCCHRTVSSFAEVVRRLNHAGDIEEVRHAVSSINSYLGLLRHYDTYGIRRRVLGLLTPYAFKYVYIRGPYEVVVLRKRYREREITLRRIRDGDS